MNVLAIDPGDTLGWARSSGANGFAKFKYDDHGRALAMFSDWIEQMLDMEATTLLVIERPFGSRGFQHRMTMLQEGVAHAAAYARKIPRTDRTADEVRGALLGFCRISAKAEPNKAQRTRDLDKLVLAAVRARGFKAINEHAADACALICCVENRMPLGN